ncbi:glutathione S-transferase [Rhizobium leguminosarum bv. trifolii WSM1689]|uniref:glutathione S-transferase family protein n=1 Tax=Rhizobium TaxID=379 RepID=UPI0003E0B58D|nr:MULTISPECIES: glutathione S-transferase [Rhizobium]AHF83089.1 glutathione S-transferase [Rhizobium leguminosarum bv. trifolii WSM1689]MBY3331870.1 glutathione S-transferase [Rhizobium laguerreae]MBY3385783.1 glutathione S-transferase [Rhizobium laguerreae]MBY3399444.1 glutathione S-transferase [Rhizobium laguerreae]MBY3406382.1 glutathione S-transferase [Rhizobium laguerreae]
MPDFKLHCFALSGNCYKVALFFALAGIKWESIFVDYLGGETRTEEWRKTINEQGEAPVLEHGQTKISQSGIILDYLSEVTGQFGAQTAEERRDVMRWILFDNHKFTSYYATLRFMYGLQKSGETPVVEFLRLRAKAAYAIVDDHLAHRAFMVGERLTIADLSLAGYVFMPEETGIDHSAFPAIAAWKDRISNMPGWRHPYDLMPGPTSL